MAVQAAKVTVGSSPTPLTAAHGNDGVGGHAVIVAVPALGQTIYLGGPDVTPSAGWPHKPTDQPFRIHLADGEALYAVVPAGTQTVNVLRQGI